MKVLKKHIIKFLAITMSVMYLLTPLKRELIAVLHSISHNLEKPTTVISHSHEFNTEVYYKTTTTYSHEHRIIDFIDIILNVATGDSDTESNKSKTIDIEFDKHFCSSKYKLLKPVLPSSSSIISLYKQNKTTKFFKKIEVPPKISDLQFC